MSEKLKVKVHCISRFDNTFTCCGRVEYTVYNVGGFIFNMIKKNHQCKRCAKSKCG